MGPISTWYEDQGVPANWIGVGAGSHGGIERENAREEAGRGEQGDMNRLNARAVMGCERCRMRIRR